MKFVYTFLILSFCSKNIDAKLYDFIFKGEKYNVYSASLNNFVVKDGKLDKSVEALLDKFDDIKEGSQIYVDRIKGYVSKHNGVLYLTKRPFKRSYLLEWIKSFLPTANNKVLKKEEDAKNKKTVPLFESLLKKIWLKYSVVKTSTQNKLSNLFKWVNSFASPFNSDALKKAEVGNDKKSSSYFEDTMSVVLNKGIGIVQEVVKGSNELVIGMRGGVDKGIITVQEKIDGIVFAAKKEFFEFYIVCALFVALQNTFYYMFQVIHQMENAKDISVGVISNVCNIVFNGESKNICSVYFNGIYGFFKQVVEVSSSQLSVYNHTKELIVVADPEQLKIVNDSAEQDGIQASVMCSDLNLVDEADIDRNFAIKGRVYNCINKDTIKKSVFAVTAFGVSRMLNYAFLYNKSDV